MRGIDRDSLSPTQGKQNWSSLEQLSLDQLEKLADKIKIRLNLYAVTEHMKQCKDMMDDLHAAACHHNEEAYLDAIECACRGIDR